ncbi:MAG: ABC transporter ATP-binding protein [Bacteroidetes bacterium]|nr:MAG: ABC transporter ATP-binding protein [Bacteroidota bacterium]
MKHLKALNKYFWKYRVRLSFGIAFVFLSNYFAVLAPQITRFVIDFVQKSLNLPGYTEPKNPPVYSGIVEWFVEWMKNIKQTNVVAICGITILVLALLRGFFLFLMRQTIIVMSRHIEYDQKNEVFQHYQKLDTAFFKTHNTGDLMNRIAEDVSRVRMFTGPALMYLVNLVAVISLSVYFMFETNAALTWYVLAPLPLLAIAIYFVNNIINRRSEKNQSLLSDLTTHSQESYSGIRVIKSFVQENAMLGFFSKKSEEYRHNAIGLAKVEAIYFPSITLLIGLSILITIMIGGIYYINGTHSITLGTIVEFVLYVTILTFPVSAIGLTASMIQRAAASQKRLNEFLQTEPEIQNTQSPVKSIIKGNIEFKNVDFIYPHTGIQGLKNFNLTIKPGERIAIIGKTGSGKSTIAQLLLRMYDCTNGEILIEGTNIKNWDLNQLRVQTGYVPQDVFLFSDSVKNNISFGIDENNGGIVEAAKNAGVNRDIEQFAEKYDTMVGERGVTLSGGQKQRVSIARALIKKTSFVIFDDCLSAVDSKTEREIMQNLDASLEEKTVIIITHRLYTLFSFDKIIVLDEGEITEQGSHNQLMELNGYYAGIYRRQLSGFDPED